MKSHLQQPTDKAAVLLEALPYLQQFRGLTILIKVGGSAMENPDLVRRLLRDVVFMEVVGMKPVLVHGGGKAISAAMKKAGLDATFVGGLRVTTDAAMEIVEKTLNTEVNAELVAGIQQCGGQTTGIPGSEVYIGERIPDLGRVGRVTEINLGKIEEAISSDIVPVVSPVAKEDKTGLSLNVNADLAASALAAELKVAKLVYLSDVLGLMQDPSDESTLIPSLTADEVDPLIESGVISGGMIPKIRSSVDALRAGVGKVHLIDGRLSHSLLLEIFTKKGVGTEILN